MQRFLLIGLLICFWALHSCDNTPKDNTTTTTSTEAQETQTTAPNIAIDTFPSVDLAILQNLWNECTYIDYVFYQLPISLSLDNQASIRHSISHISQNPAPKTSDCKAMGRIFFQVDGENELEGDIYFSQGCTYFVWLDKKGNKFAGNWMTEDGVKFMNRNFQAARGQMEPK